MENQPLIFKSIIKVMSEINAVGKDRKNQTQGFQYRGIDDIMNELHGTLAKCGVFVVPNVLEESRTTGKTSRGGDMFYTRLKICFTFYAEDGSNIQSVVIGEAMDTADKASNKALSVGLKYALLQVFCIPTEEEKDPDAQTPEPKAGSMTDGSKTTPPKKPAQEAELKGGASTEAEKARIKELCEAKYADGAAVFSRDEKLTYSGYRKDRFTAAELIAFIENALRNRRGDAPELKTAEPTAAELAEQAMSGAAEPNFDTMPPSEPPAEQQGFDIY